MKHLLNNLSDNEKNNIREQHTGGMKVSTENFSKLINSKLGDSKTFIKEQMDVSSDSDHYQRRKREVKIPFDELSMLGQFASDFCSSKQGLPDCQSVREIMRKYNLFM